MVSSPGVACRYRRLQRYRPRRRNVGCAEPVALGCGAGGRRGGYGRLRPAHGGDVGVGLPVGLEPAKVIGRLWNSAVRQFLLNGNATI